VCQNQHDLAAADNIFHPEFGNHYVPEGHPIPSTNRPAGSPANKGARIAIRVFPDTTYGPHTLRWPWEESEVAS
jgi:hypothetical protein